MVTVKTFNLKLNVNVEVLKKPLTTTMRLPLNSMGVRRIRDHPVQFSREIGGGLLRHRVFVRARSLRRIIVIRVIRATGGCNLTDGGDGLRGGRDFMKR